jgi:pilus assembly protein CpaE
MTNNPVLLLVSPDPKLPDEFAAALRGISDHNAVTHSVTELRQGIEAIRSRRPDVAIVDMTTDLGALKTFAEEAAVGSPETAVVAVFSPHLFGPDVSESAILIEAMRAGVRDFLRRPLSTADLQGLLERLLHRPRAVRTRQGKIIAFASNKGGVGKSTLSANIACGLARSHPEQVLLIDASLQMGVCASMLNLKPKASLTDAVHERNRLDEVLIRQLATPHECGLHLLAAPADALEAAEVDDELMARVLTLARRAYDYVLVDSFPMLDRVMIAVLDLSDRVYIVMESVVPTILGAVQFIKVLDGLGLRKERQRIILNRYSNFAGNLRPDDVALRLRRDVDHVVAYEKKLLIAANLGTPYLLSSGRWFNPFARKLRQIIAEIERLEGASAGPKRRPLTPSPNGQLNQKEARV